MARQQAEVKTETTATDRLKELTRRRTELEEQRRRISEGMGEALRKDKVEMILRGGDPDVVMQDHEEALTSIDNKLAILGSAIRELSAAEALEKAAKKRAELERDKPAYVQALRQYIEAIRALHEAEQELQKHEAFRVSPIGFPGLSMTGFERRERGFGETLRVRGIDPEEVGIDLPERPRIVERPITEAMRKALAKRYFTVGKASEVHDFSHTQSPRV
jgi:hypothetical protein